jgi:hypothetical protein
MSNCFNQVRTLIPDFDLGRCEWIRSLELWEDDQGICVRMVLDYAGVYDLVLVAKNVYEIPVIPPAKVPGVLPYAPYDLGELFASTNGSEVLISDELKGWRLAADDMVVEGLISRDQ